MKRNLIFLLVLFLFSCIAACAFDECEEDRQDNCTCAEINKPVCGCNNKTYGNACEAECNGITNYREGKCE